MVFDSTILARLASDLRRQIVGARVDRVFAVSRDEVVLDLRRRVPRPQLVFSWSAEMGRAHLSADHEPRPDLHLPFVDSLRKELRGATITACGQVGFDRILEVEFANCEGLGPGSRASLVAEIMGRHANLILRDADGTILSCAKLINSQVNRYREIMPGVRYVPPPGGHRLDPRQLTVEGLLSPPEPPVDDEHETSAVHGGMELRQYLRGVLMGASDLFLDELVTRSRLEGERPVGSQPGAWASQVCEAAADLLAEAEKEGSAFLYEGAVRRGKRTQVFAYPLVLQSHLDFECRQVDDLGAALDELVGTQLVSRELQSGRDHLTAILSRALARTEARVRERELSLAEAEDADGLRRRGELILANLHAIPAGAAEVEVTDYYDPDQATVTLKLDPHYSAKENAQAAFERYRRARRILDRVPGLLAEARAEGEYLQGVQQQVETAEDTAELSQLEEELRRGGFLHEQAKRARSRDRSGAVEPRRATTRDGYPMLYGKTGAQNDAVVRTAAPEDLWFHVKDGPGGHVVIRTSGRPDEVPESSLREAAALAASLSHWRNDAHVPVNYTAVKHVHKPKGARPGFVTYTDFRTLHVDTGHERG